MKLLWTAPAAADRRSIRNWIARDNPRAAIALDELLAAKAATLLEHPGLGRTGRVVDTRELVAHKSYLLIYDVTPNAVRILRVLHTARQWPQQTGTRDRP